MDGKLAYTEGTFIGYRGRAAGRAPEPRFWFGHGLGYGRWDCADASLVDPDGPAQAVAVTVTNTGDRPSQEVVQVYLRPSERDQPVRLVGWQAVAVEPGASARVTVSTDARLWRRSDTPADGWTMLAHGGELLVARGLGGVHARSPFS